MIEYTPIKYPYNLNKHQMAIIDELITDANIVYPRLSAVRFDLRYPNNGLFSDDHIEKDAPCSALKEDSNTMKRFFSSLRKQVAAYIVRKKRDSRYAPHTELFYVWKREASVGGAKEHYHVAVFVNNDVFRIDENTLVPDVLVYMIERAWATATGINMHTRNRLAFFAKRGRYKLNKNDYHYERNLERLRTRLYYLAKEETSVRGNGKRSFGYSTLAKKMALEKQQAIEKRRER